MAMCNHAKAIAQEFLLQNAALACLVPKFGGRILQGPSCSPDVVADDTDAWSSIAQSLTSTPPLGWLVLSGCLGNELFRVCER